MKARSILTINTSVINRETFVDSPPFSFGDTTYRRDGLSIGQDYLRVDGKTISRGKLTKDRLQLAEVVGKGAFSKVRLASWTVSFAPYEEVAVAVKEWPILDASRERRQMLLKELKTLASVSSPALVRLHGAFLDNDVVTMVTEYMDLGDLVQWRKRFPSAIPDYCMASIAFQLLTGLAHLHKHRRLHRDIKPENVLLDKLGHVKWCDFGMANLGDVSLNTTVLGTTKFMAPERLRAKPYGRASDMWSLALVLIETGSGEKLWSNVSSIVDLLVTIEECNTQDLIPASMSDGLAELVSACLWKDPDKRVPAAVLLRSPWFTAIHGIDSVDDAVHRMQLFLQKQEMRR